MNVKVKTKLKKAFPLYKQPLNSSMLKPADRLTFEGEIATYWWEGSILVADSKSIRRTVVNIAGNVSLVKQITGDKPVPLLIHLKNSPVPDRETQKLSTTQLPTI